MKITCPCGTIRHVPESHAYIQHCSRPCYEMSRKLDPARIARMERIGYNKKQMAVAVGLSYPQFRRRYKSDILTLAT